MEIILVVEEGNLLIFSMFGFKFTFLIDTRITCNFIYRIEIGKFEIHVDSFLKVVELGLEKMCS